MPRPVCRVTDITACGDPVQAGSPDILVNGLPRARVSDPTGGHADWVPTVLTGPGSPAAFDHGLPVCAIGDKHAGHVNSQGVFHLTALATGSPDTMVE